MYCLFIRPDTAPLLSGRNGCGKIREMYTIVEIRRVDRKFNNYDCDSGKSNISTSLLSTSSGDQVPVSTNSPSQP